MGILNNGPPSQCNQPRPLQRGPCRPPALVPTLRREVEGSSGSLARESLSADLAPGDTVMDGGIPVRFQTIMPSPLGIYTRVNNVTLLLDLAESGNLFPEGTQQSASTSGAYLGEAECQGLSAEWLQKQDIWLQHGGRSLRPHHSFCTRSQRPLGQSLCVFVGSYGQ